MDNIFDDFLEEELNDIAKELNSLEEKKDDEIQEDIEPEESVGESYDESVYQIYSSPGYPSTFPTLSELQALKNLHRDMFFCVVGSYADLLLGGSTEPFIIRKAKQADIIKFSAEGGDYRNVAAFDSFLVRECTVVPKMSQDDVENLGIGTLNFLAAKIRNASKLGSEGFVKRM